MKAAAWFLLGLMAGLLNCALSSTGFILQRRAKLLSEEEQRDGEPRKHRSLAALGVVLYVLAAGPDVLAYALLPQIVCTAMGCFRLVVVTFMAHAVLKERLGRRELVGIFSCSIGTFVCLVFGPGPEPDEGEEGGELELWPLRVRIYVVIGLALLVVLLVVDHAPSAAHWCRERGVHYVALPLATGLAYALEKVFNREIGLMRSPGSFRGLLENPMWDITGFSILLLGIADFYLNMRGAWRMPVQVFIPLAFALCTGLQFLQSVFLFGELRRLDPPHAALAICGAIVSLAGALLIQVPRMGSADHKLAQPRVELSLIDEMHGEH